MFRWLTGTDNIEYVVKGSKYLFIRKEFWMGHDLLPERNI